MTDPIQQLEALKGADFHGVHGKFHSHITVRTDDLPGLQQFCRAHKIKLTVIDLDAFTADTPTQRDVMTTQHHRPDATHGEAVLEIISQLQRLCMDLQAHHYEVLRVKLEHESLPTLPHFDPHHYREVHIKLSIPLASFETTMFMLASHASRFGYVPSRNPLAKHRTADTPHATQFLNMRFYEGSLSEIDAKVQAVVDFLTAHDVAVAEVKQETTLFDTHLQHDRWWA
jgi:hypothetical protein